MASALDGLSVHELRAIAEALRTGRLAVLPPTQLALQRYCTAQVAVALVAELATWKADASTLAMFLDLLANERSAAQEQRVDLVWTGPEVPGAASRDTGAVVRELFLGAKRSVLIAGYAVHQGREVFRVLAERMDREPDLDVRMFLDIQRGRGDTTIDADLVRRFGERLRRVEWSGRRFPQVFYDPRSLSSNAKQRSALHAKCVVVDGALAFVSSANFTRAAQVRNIEVGVVVRERSFAERLVAQFETLVDERRLCAVPAD